MSPRLRPTTVDAGPFTMPTSALMHGAEGTLTVPSTVAITARRHAGRAPNLAW